MNATAPPLLPLPPLGYLGLAPLTQRPARAVCRLAGTLQRHTTNAAAPGCSTLVPLPPPPHPHAHTHARTNGRTRPMHPPSTCPSRAPSTPAPCIAHLHLPSGSGLGACQDLACHHGRLGAFRRGDERAQGGRCAAAGSPVDQFCMHACGVGVGGRMGVCRHVVGNAQCVRHWASSRQAWHPVQLLLAHTGRPRRGC